MCAMCCAVLWKETAPSAGSDVSWMGEPGE